MVEGAIEFASPPAITMLSHSLRNLLIALVASTTAVSAAPGLTVRTSTTNAEVDGLENLKVTTTVTNTGDEILKLLNDPCGVLSPFPENSFRITDSVGSRPLFSGAKVNHSSGFRENVHAHAFGPHFQAIYSPAHAASLGDPAAFTILAPGASVDVVHDSESGHIIDWGMV